MEAATSLLQVFSFSEFFGAAAKSLAHLLGADGVALIVYEGPNRLRYKLFHGLEQLNQAPTVSFSFPADRGTVGRVLSSGKPLFTPDYPNSEDAMPEFIASGLRANLVLPLPGPSGFMGAMTVAWLHRQPPSPTREHMTIARLFAALTGSAIYRETLEKQLQDHSLTDPLTGLPNRRMLMHRLVSAQKRSCRSQLLMVLAVLDLDGFKSINDELGHATGDQRLVLAAHSIRTAIREVDTVARLGGDEFVIILEELRSFQEAQIILDRIVRAVATCNNNDGDTYKVTASLGASIYPLDFSEPDALLQHADTAMYQSKRNGGNRFTIYSTT